MGRRIPPVQGFTHLVRLGRIPPLLISQPQREKSPAHSHHQILIPLPKGYSSTTQQFSQGISPYCLTLFGKACQIWHDHPFSQPNRATKRAVRVEFGGEEQLDKIGKKKKRLLGESLYERVNQEPSANYEKPLNIKR